MVHGGLEGEVYVVLFLQQTWNFKEGYSNRKVVFQRGLRTSMFVGGSVIVLMETGGNRS